MKLPALVTGQNGNGSMKPAENVGQAPAKEQPKMDLRTAMLYSKALDAQDSGDSKKAAELYRAVLDKFPDYAPAKAGLAKASKSGD
jgi:TolA-binding protein